MKYQTNIGSNVKDEGANMNTMTTTLKSIVSYESLSMMEWFQGTYFEHACYKTYQYAIVEERVFRGLKYVFLKFAQANLQKRITWPKNSRKGKDEWMKAYITIGFRLKKLNTLVKRK
jgi:hypothetical protein